MMRDEHSILGAFALAALLYVSVAWVIAPLLWPAFEDLAGWVGV